MAESKSDLLMCLNKSPNTVVCLVITCISFWYNDLAQFLYTIKKSEIQVFLFFLPKPDSSGYLEPYEAKGYVFCRIETEAGFSEYAGKADTVMAFVEDGFFGERTMGRLDYIRRQYPKLRLVLFSASCVPPDAAARYLCWSLGSYLSLRDSEGEIGECLEAVFERRQAVPSYLRGRVEEYAHLTDIEPHLTHREIEIVRYAAEGKTAKETAAALMVSQRTVTSHLCGLYPVRYTQLSGVP